MLTFNKSFFYGETKCGFFIDSMIKRAWAAQLEMLCNIIDVCQKYNITYYAFWGTMLGAIRHQGFIPWDDDIDIVMLRKDYDKLLEVATKELPEKYVIISPYTQVEWQEQFARITNCHSINYSKEHLEANHGFPFVAGIDIFPLDYIPDNEDLANQQMHYLDLIASVRASVIRFTENNNTKSFNIDDEKLNNNLHELEQAFGFTFKLDYYLDNQLLCLFDQVCANFGSSFDSRITCFADRRKSLNENGIDFLFEKNWFDGIESVPFENIMINLPSNYHECLKVCFGDNYMTPVIFSAGHDYPFFKSQMELLKKMGRYDDVMLAIEQYDKEHL